MAIDTAQKRASAATVAAPWNGPSIISDGGFAQADRQQIAWSYSGILAGAPPPAAPPAAVPAAVVEVGGPYRPLPQIVVVWVTWKLPVWVLVATTFMGRRRQKAEAALQLPRPSVRAASQHTLVAGATIAAEAPMMSAGERLTTRAWGVALALPVRIESRETVVWGEHHKQRLMEDDAVMAALLFGGKL